MFTTANKEPAMKLKHISAKYSEWNKFDQLKLQVNIWTREQVTSYHCTEKVKKKNMILKRHLLEVVFNQTVRISQVMWAVFSYSNDFNSENDKPNYSTLQQWNQNDTR